MAEKESLGTATSDRAAFLDLISIVLSHMTETGHVVASLTALISEPGLSKRSRDVLSTNLEKYTASRAETMKEIHALMADLKGKKVG